jgi:cell division cycle 2-like protein
VVAGDSKPAAAAPAAPAARLPLGECRSVDCYARLNLIAESQHGIVYRARNKATGTIVALKKFKTRKEPDGFPITFLREINILFTIKHPHIITADEMVYGGSGDELHWFLVMEYVEHDLKDLITTMKTPFVEGQAPPSCGVLGAPDLVASVCRSSTS